MFGMIDVTANVASVQTIRTADYEAARDNVLHKQDQGGKRIAGNMPAEKIYSGGNTGVETGLQAPETTKSTHTVEDGQLVFRRYDENGKLIQRVPPGYVPISEMV